MADLHVVILAAGKGTRMRSRVPKVLHRVAGRPMIEHVLRTATPLAPASITLIVGHDADRVRERLADNPQIRFAVQEPQLGTGHALLQAAPLLEGTPGSLLLLSGDVPLLTPSTLRQMILSHQRAGAAVTVLTAVVDQPFGYGRAVRLGGRLARIVEERDASPEERQIREINAGIYLFELPSIFDSLRGVASRNAQGEYYLTDLIAICHRRGQIVETVTLEGADEIRGINSRIELAEASTIVRQVKNQELMAAGVTIDDPGATYIDADVRIGPDTIIHPGVHLEGRTQIGAGCEIHSGVRIVDSTLGDQVIVNNFCVITGATIATGARIGPFAHLRPDADVREDAHVGNFVELKKTVLGAGSKAGHLAYLGDATIGEKVNVGAGTITCNYDGERKHPTVIEDGAFIGSASQLVAPVRVGRGAYIAAGSSITADVPAGSLGIGRSRQVNLEGWVARKKQRDGG